MSDGKRETGRMQVGRWDVAGGILVAAEGVGVLALAAWQVVAILQGNTDSLESAIALVVLTVMGAAAVIGFAAAILRGKSWGRSGGIVTQLLILAVAGGAMTGAAAVPLLGVEIAIPGVIGIVVLIVAAARAGRGSSGGPRS